MGEEYGILIYDVPCENKDLYYRLRTRIGKSAIRMNLSVYLFQWGRKEEMEAIVKQAREETGEYAKVCVLKFDDREEVEIQRIARESLAKTIRDIGARLHERIEKARDNIMDLPDVYLVNVRKRLEEAQGLAVLFGLTQDVEYALEAVMVVVREENAAAEVRMTGKVRVVAESPVVIENEEIEDGENSYHGQESVLAGFAC